MFKERFLEIHKKGTFFLLSRAIIFLIFLPLVILIRLLRPLVRIRISTICSERIGHFAINTELYLSKKDMVAKETERIADIFYFSSPVCNQQLALMWKRRLRIWPIAKLIDKTNQLIPGKEAHEVMEIATDWDVDGILSQTKPHLLFTEEEEKFGGQQLRVIGVPEGKPFVCFIARDSAYLKSQFPQLDYSYHDYRDADIMKCVPAMEGLVQRGYVALRMGAVVESPLSEQKPGIVDYASLHRSDFMDIYLGSKCSFFLTDTCGFGAIPTVFRRPVVLVNWIPLGHILVRMINNYLIIPKKLWFRDKKRFMTISEITSSEFMDTLDGEAYRKRGIEVVDNTPEEIRDAVLEMEERLRGVWQTNEEYEQLQGRFWDMVKPDQKNQMYRPRIGSKFLMQNQDLLK